MSDVANVASADRSDRGLIAFFVGNPIAGKLLMVLLLAGGAFTATKLEVATLPELEPVQIAVVVPYPGSSAAEVSEDINRRVEEHLIPLHGVDRVTSYARAGLGRVVVDLGAFTDRQDALDDIRSAVARIERFPPPAAEEPEIIPVKMPRNVITVAVTSNALSPIELTAVADQVREDLLAHPEVAVVSPYAMPEREISIEASEEVLRRHGLSIRELAAKVNRTSLNLSSGEVRTDVGELMLRTQSKRTFGEEFADIVVMATEDGETLRLSDVAEISDGLVDTSMATRIDGQSAVLLSIDRNEGQDALTVAEAVREMIAAYEAPPSTEVFVWNDSTELVWSRIATLTASGFLGFSLVFILLAVVLDFRVALWVAIGVPTSFLGALLLFPALDLSISVIAILALVIMIGIVVDDAVIVGESIASRHEAGELASQAAIAGARAVRAPVVTGVLTTAVAFAPLLFISGVLGQMVLVVPLVVWLVLAVSLAEAFLILPAHLANHSSPLSRWPLNHINARVSKMVTNWRNNIVAPAIAWAVARPYATLLASAAFVVAAVLLAVVGAVRTDQNQGLGGTGRIQVDLTFQPGTPFAVTEAAAERVAKAARAANRYADDEPFRTVAVVVGQNLPISSLSGPGQTQKGSHLASVIGHVVDESRRSLSLDDLERLWSANIGDVPGALSVRTTAANTWSGLWYALTHPDAKVLAPAVAELRETMQRHPAISYVEDSLAPGKLQYDIELTERGNAAGLSPGAVASQLRSRFHGDDAQRVQRGRDEIKVMVRYLDDDRGSLRELRDERIRRADGVEMPLGAVARIIETRQPALTMRIDGVPAAEVAVRLNRHEVTATVRDDLERVFNDLIERYPGLTIAPGATTGQEDDIIDTLLYTYPIALLVMYGIIAVQFRSYWQPLVILAGIPLAFAGAAFGHWFLGYSAAVPSSLGFVAVSGVVVNDTLVLMHRYNQIRAEGQVPAVAAVSAAARQRFRAIALTTATTVVGMTPLLLTHAEVLISFLPMVVSLVFGLIAASAAVLFLVPSVLLLGETAREQLAARNGA